MRRSYFNRGSSSISTVWRTGLYIAAIGVLGGFLAGGPFGIMIGGIVGGAIGLAYAVTATIILVRASNRVNHANQEQQANSPEGLTESSSLLAATRELERRPARSPRREHHHDKSGRPAETVIASTSDSDTSSDVENDNNDFVSRNSPRFM